MELEEEEDEIFSLLFALFGDLGMEGGKVGKSLQKGGVGEGGECR